MLQFFNTSGFIASNGFQKRINILVFGFKTSRILLLQELEFFPILTLFQLIRLHVIEKNGWFVKLVKHKDHYADKKNNKLHGNFQKSVHNQPHPAFCK